MGKTMNATDLMKRPFSDLTVSEQAAVLRARYDEETSEPGSQRIKTRGSIGEEYRFVRQLCRQTVEAE